MGKNFKSMKGGKLRVSIPKGYAVYKKDFPNSLMNSNDYNKYSWVGNFGFKKKSSGKKFTGNFKKAYEIRVENRSNKDLVYWNGKMTIKFSGTEVRNKYKIAKLKMGDPPVGWAN